jgi:hypothetical protein
MNTVKVKSDVVVNQSSKTIVVSKNQSWAINSIFATLASTATVGNRQIRLSILTDADVLLYSVDAISTQAASLTYKYAFLPGAANEDQHAKLWNVCRLPLDTVLPAGYKIKIEDTAAIDAAADDMTVQVMYVPSYSSL